MSAETKPELTIYYCRPGFKIIEPDELMQYKEELDTVILGFCATGQLISC